MKRQRACKPGSVHRACNRRDWAAIPLGDGLPHPSSNQPGQRAGTRPLCRPYSVLHPVGFTVPALLPGPRCALAAPFRPYVAKAARCPFCGTVPDLRRSEGRRALPGTVVPWSPDFPRGGQVLPAAARPSGCLNMGYCGLGSNKASSFARHSPSIMPSMRSGRNRRWKAITAFCGSVTSYPNRSSASRNPASVQ